MNIKFNALAPTDIYHLMTQTIIPRPIAWVLTQNKTTPSNTDKQSFNLAPFSYFNAVCSQPPLLMISIGQKPTGGDKDTSANLAIGQKCVVHIATVEQADEVTQSAATLEYGQSELDNLGLDLVTQDAFSIPRIGSCPIAYNCEVYQRQEIGDAPQQLVFLKIVSVYISDAATDTDDKGRLMVAANKIMPLARLGANQYSGISDVIDRKRPS